MAKKSLKKLLHITHLLHDGKPIDKIASACWLVAVVIFSAFLFNNKGVVKHDIL